MIDHLNLPVNDLAVSSAFYKPVLTTLGFQVLHEDSDVVGFGIDHWIFGIVADAGVNQPMHLAFNARSREQVSDFYRVALQHGGRCNGKPGLRPDYGTEYFAAYVIDPDGNNIEAVCRVSIARI